MYNDPYDHSYMTTEYARNKMIESYQLEAKEKTRMEALVDNVLDDLKWAGEGIINFRYNEEHRVRKCRRYIEDAMDKLDGYLSKLDDININEDDWREDR
jgi:hypothetical protein